MNQVENDVDASTIEMLSYKEQKEAFVTGHEGTTPWEVLLVCLSAPIGVACYQQLMIYNNAGSRGKVEDNNSIMSSRIQSILLEAILVWFPMVLCQTKFLYPYGVAFLTIQSTIVLALRRLILSKKKNKPHASSNSSKNDYEDSSKIRLDFLTAYRSSILYLTFVAILAVDFHVFPRRFAKTEVYGYGLMDVGAASFCFSAGLVSRQAKPQRPTATSQINLKQVLHTLPLVIIGLLRTWTNKELDYQEHVSEYGVHWNFFFTMGVMVIVPSIMVPAKPTLRGTWILPAAILVLYQLALSFGKLQDYIETAPRKCDANHNATSSSSDSSSWSLPCVGFVAANREGIFGCLGYLSLYFIGEYIGRDFLWKRKPLWKPTIVLVMLFLVSSQVVAITVSRRSTNLTFCLWAAAHNVLLLAVFEEVMKKNNKCGRLPIVMETVNRVGLPIFLIANLLTGLVNLTIPTLEVADGPALWIVFGYICLVGGAAMLVDWAIQSVLLGKASKAEKEEEEAKKKD
mmetsp:Transcript_12642/g.30190  ORF Transcript_12642/g.30190 Transcript_12642/m.30190 type:complete len:514 (+) Transcript_12642:85-1626(+)|eukprot:CAMPEP_0113629934 /NCGR_PEP_ID=MMETSP0017_2-20120614/15546_1 /TAXON_ID=2856 /ORGANISM="Cylindrotheca closterium" /LENGTH=513 /DNA_ID=CAMNT_0000540365 /DNA_START=18 /DNA_END=1559 /DNA_ORIENTATION=+ /assembly_acc=CAM_ASM_000147